MSPPPKHARVTSSLVDVNNDTGRTAFCGPYIVSALSGYPISRIEDEIRKLRALPQNNEQIIKGTTSDEVKEVLFNLGYTMTLKADYMDLPRKERPTLWQWMQKPRNAWVHYILAISKGKQGHWILIKGVKICDTYTDGQWKFVCDGPHRGSKISEIFEVRKSLVTTPGK